MNIIDKGSGRVFNTKRNIIYGLFQTVLSVFLPFVVRTILIYRFGADYLGLSNLFTSVLSVLSLMELGFGAAIVYSMYKPVAENDIDQICAYLAYYKRIYQIIGCVILFAGILVLPFLKFLILEGNLPGNLNMYVCYLIFLGDAVISYLLFGYMTSIPQVYQRRDILSKINMGISLLQCAVKVIVLLVCSNFYFYLLSIPVITVIRNLTSAAIIRKKYPELKCRGALSREQKNDLNKKVYGLLVSKITAVSRNSIDTLCITSFIGLAVSGIYSNYYYIMTSLVAFSAMILNSMMASVGNSIATENPEKNYRDMRLFDFIYSSIAGWATVCLVCLYRPFIQMWLGEGMMLEMPIVIALCIYFYILKTGDIRYVYQEGVGQWYEYRYIMIGEAIANVILNVGLCKVFGLLGIVLATVITVFVTNMFFCPRILFRLYFKNGKLKEYWMDHIVYFVTMFITALTSSKICELLIIRDYSDKFICILGMVARLGICTVISVAVFWVIWHRSERYRASLQWMKKMIRVKGN